MSFKQEFLAALRSAAGHESLLNLVQRRQPEFASLREVYNQLEEIWLELGFDRNEEASPRDDLEFVMEKVWYECPVSNKD